MLLLESPPRQVLALPYRFRRFVLDASLLLVNYPLCLLKQPYHLSCLIGGKRDSGRRPHQFTIINQIMKPEIDPS